MTFTVSPRLPSRFTLLCLLIVFCFSENAPENNAAPWQKEEAEEVKPEEDFDEAAYLRGKIPLLRQSVDRDSSLPPRGKIGSIAYKPTICI